MTVPIGTSQQATTCMTLTVPHREFFEYMESINPPADKSIIVMLADGYGPHVHTMARDVARHIEDDPTLRLPLDDHLVGSAATMPVCNSPPHEQPHTRIHAKHTSFRVEVTCRCG